MPGPEHRADALFTLPRLPRKVAVLGDPPGWLNDLRELDIEATRDADADVDAVVATDDFVERALRANAGAVLVDGTSASRRRLRDAGLKTRQLLPLPVSGSPLLFVDLGARRAARYGIDNGIVHTEPWRIWRNRLAALLARAGALPVRAGVSVGTRSADVPALLRSVHEHGVDASGGWIMFVSAGSVVRRNAFTLFPRGASRPSHVLKFARVPGLASQFERDERGAALARQAGGVVAARAPAFLARFNIDGYEASLETAAVGGKLANLLRQPGSRSRKLKVVEAVAQWLVQVARETATQPAALTPELRRLESTVIPEWASAGGPTSIPDALASVPAAFQHNDVAEDNIVVDDGEFTVLDWEWAQEHGLPLGDLVYFAVHVLRIVDGALTEEERDRHFVDVLTGRARSSPLLFRWVREAVGALELDPDAVGPLMTLSWLDRGALSRRERVHAEEVAGTSLGLPFAERAASLWLTSPGLGATWRAWQDA